MLQPPRPSVRHLSLPPASERLQPNLDPGQEDWGHPPLLLGVHPYHILYFRLCDLKSLHGKSQPEDGRRDRGAKVRDKNAKQKKDGLGDMSSDAEGSMERPESETEVNGTTDKLTVSRSHSKNIRI